MKYGYPKVGRTDEEMHLIKVALQKAFPKYSVRVAGESEMLIQKSDDQFDRLVTATISIGFGLAYWRYPISSKLEGPWVEDNDATAGLFIRALFLLGKGYDAGVLVANRGLDTDRLADLLTAAGGSL